MILFTLAICSGKGGVETLQHSHDVLALAYRPDGKLLASATLDGQIYLWDPQEGHLLVSIPFLCCTVPGLQQVSRQPCKSPCCHTAAVCNPG